MAVCIFIVGSILQTAAVDYAMLIVGRLIGGIGIGMFVIQILDMPSGPILTSNRMSMVVPMYIGEVSPPEIRGLSPERNRF